MTSKKKTVVSKNVPYRDECGNKYVLVSVVRTRYQYVLITSGDKVDDKFVEGYFVRNSDGKMFKNIFLNERAKWKTVFAKSEDSEYHYLTKVL